MAKGYRKASTNVVSKKISVTLPNDVFDDIDAMARRLRISFSAALNIRLSLADQLSKNIGIGEVQK